ncbi:hypothetical protein RAC89_26035 [Paenibacillus sp. GD4]|uniref:hypothetical protein n=1 Tax=Paenibacillus sp. GD4 TaxID=3068890 RepID=UPI00279689DA|nr:hypothetical protein [Paenibacillus sp. GD4]MDQ1913866.1 hypothetical protein [Paenibacillus sp. GD4]
MIRLPLLFIATGVISFVLFHLLSLFTFGAWVVEPPRNPDGWFRIHLLVLDWATMIAMGAVYQLIDVVLQRRIHSRMLGYVHYAFFTVGSILLLTGFLRVNTGWIAVGASITFIGILLFAWNVGHTLRGAKQWNPITVSTACSIGYLVLTGVFGTAMGLNFAFNLWGEVHEQLLSAHIWVGTLGWFGLLITGFSYKMLPMFYLSHGAAERPQHIITCLWNAGVLLGAVTFLLQLHTFFMGVSILLLVTALFVYDHYIVEIRKHRHKPMPGRGILWTIWCTRVLFVFSLCIFIVWLISPEHLWSSTWVLLAGWVYLWGWVAMTILGYLSKIVPFLWWTHKYGPQAGKPDIPVMSDMIDEKLVHRGMLGMALGLGIAILGMGFSITQAAAAGISIVSLFSLFYIGLVVKVFTR